jgi:hypothetical protein
MDEGSDSWDLKASSAARSVSLLGAGDEMAMNGISSKLVAISMTGMYEGAMLLDALICVFGVCFLARDK